MRAPPLIAGCARESFPAPGIRTGSYSSTRVIARPSCEPSSPRNPAGARSHVFLFAAIVQWPVRPARPGSLLRAHIAKEDDCLASVVHRAFSDEDLESLTEQFEAVSYTHLRAHE